MEMKAVLAEWGRWGSTLAFNVALGVHLIYMYIYYFIIYCRFQCCAKLSSYFYGILMFQSLHSKSISLPRLHLTCDRCVVPRNSRAVWKFPDLISPSKVHLWSYGDDYRSDCKIPTFL